MGDPFSVGSDMDKQIDAYCSLLIKWNHKINLIGHSTESEIRKRHVDDCLQLQEFISGKKASIVDLGSGAGLPGVILAIGGYENITLIESDQKKCVFLREVRRELNLHYDVLNSRIEEIKDKTFSIITSRALASLEHLIELSLPLMDKDSICYFLKGENVTEEISDAQKRYSFNFKLYPSKTSCTGSILEVKNISTLN